MACSERLDSFLSIITWACLAWHLSSQLLLSLEFSLPNPISNCSTSFRKPSWSSWLSLVSPVLELLVHGLYTCTTSFALPIYILYCDKIFHVNLLSFPRLWLSWRQGLCLIYLYFFSDLHSLSTHEILVASIRPSKTQPLRAALLWDLSQDSSPI